LERKFKLFNQKTKLCVLLLGTMVAVAALAQTGTSARNASEGQTFTPPFSSQPVFGRPFSAEESLEFLPAKGIGLAVSTSTSKLFRDSLGRTRSEPPRQPRNNTMLAEIVDPSAGCWYILDARTRTAYKSPLRELVRTVKHFDAPPDPTKNQLLGSQILLGQSVDGRRATVIIGKAADGTPQTLTTESWKSEELSLIMLLQTVDGVGKNTSRISNLQLTEPPADLFRVPEGYQIVEVPSVFVVK
jgi:hypothetical protein